MSNRYDGGAIALSATAWMPSERGIRAERRQRETQTQNQHTWTSLLELPSVEGRSHRQHERFQGLT